MKEHLSFIIDYSLKAIENQDEDEDDNKTKRRHRKRKDCD